MKRLSLRSASVDVSLTGSGPWPLILEWAVETEVSELCLDMSDMEGI